MVAAAEPASLRHQLKATAIRVVEVAPPIVDTGLGGDTRSGGVASSRMMPAEDFAAEALTKLAADEDEILVAFPRRTADKAKPCSSA